MIEHLNSDSYEKENIVAKLRNENKNVNNSAKGTLDDEAKSGNNKGQGDSNKLDSFTKNEDAGEVKTFSGSMDSKHNVKDNVKEKQDNFVEEVVQASAKINVSGQSESMKQLIQSNHYLEDDIAYDQDNSISGNKKNTSAKENSYKEVNHVDGQIEPTPKMQFIQSIHYLEDDSAYDQDNLVGTFIKNKNATENSFKEVNHGQGKSRGEDKNSDDSAKEKYKMKLLKNKFDEQFLTLSSDRIKHTTNTNTPNRKKLQTKVAEDKVTTGVIGYILHLELLFTFHR